MKPASPGTKTALLDLAQQLAQTRGLNAFSFQDLAKGVGIRTASVHHHFPTKADLARELMLRYRDRFRERLESLRRRTRSPRRRLQLFCGLFLDTLREGNRLCLCGMLASEFATLPEPARAEVRAFYDETEAWLAGVLEEGRSAGAFRLHGPAPQVAASLLATLEGAMIAARTFDDERRLARAASWAVASLANPGRKRGP